MKKKFSYNITKRAALPRSERLRNVGVAALTAKSFAVETGNWLPREEFDNLFEPVYNEEGGISHILAKYTLLSLGDVQSKKYTEIAGGGSGSAIELLTEWSDYTIADKDWLGLSAGLGVELHKRLTVLENQGGAGFDPSLLEDYATKDWINDQGYVKTSDLAVYATRDWVSEQGFLTQHQSLDDYLTKTLASQTYLGIDATAKAANKLATTAAFTAWGQTFFENGVPKNVNGVFRELIAGSLNGGVAHSILNNAAAPYGLITRIYGNGSVSLQAQRETTSSEWFDLILNPLGGKVGVKTTSPAYDLDVNGVARVSQLKVGKFTLTDKGDYLEFDGTILALGDVQSKKYANIAGGGSGGGDFSIMSSWDASLAADPDFALSAGLGYDLYLNKLSKSEAEELYQPKGNYALASALGDYVTKNTEQEITGTKTFNADVKIYNHAIFFKTTRDNGVMIFGNSNSDTLQFAHHKNYVWQKGFGTLDINGNMTMSSFIKYGGTSAQFLKADGSVDSRAFISPIDIASGTDIAAMKDNGWYFAPTDGISQSLTNRPFDNSFMMLQQTCYNSGVDIRRARIAVNAYGMMKLFNDRDTDGNGGAWYDVITSNNYASILDGHYIKTDRKQTFNWVWKYNPTHIVGFDSSDSSNLYVFDGATIRAFANAVNKSGDTMTGNLIFDGGLPRLKCHSTNGMIARTYYFIDNKDAIQGGLGALWNNGVYAFHYIGWGTEPWSAYNNLLISPTELKYKNNAIWHSGNDGAGSGLDADLLDGLHETSFFRYRGEIPTAYVDITNYNSGAAEYTNYHPGIFSIARSGYSELLINFARNAGSTSALQFKTSYADNTPLYFRKTIDSNRVSGAWRTILTELNIGNYNAGSATKLQTSRNFSVADYYGDHTGAAVGFNGTAAVTLKLPEDVNVRNLIGKGSVTAKNGLIAADDTYGGLYAYGGAASYRARIWARRLTGSWGTDDIWVDVDSNGKSIFYHPIEIRGDVVVKGTILATGDVQSKKAGPNYDEVVRITLTGSDETVSIPASASEAIITVWGDGWTKTIQLTGDINDLDVLKLTIYDYGGMGDTWKYGNTSFTVTSGKGNVLALVRMSSTSVRFMKLI